MNTPDKRIIDLHPGNNNSSASAGGGKLIGYVKNGDTIFPLGAQKNDYVRVDGSNTEFPFTIQGITFETINDQAIYTGSQWILYSFIVKTSGVEVEDPNKESLNGNSTLQNKINEEVKIAIEDIRDKLKKQFKFVGFISTTEPTGNVLEGDLWYNSTTLPELTDFPIQVKVYEKVGDTYQWSSTTIEYRPSNFDTWSNKNDDKGYYWFANMWNITDANVLVDDLTITINNIGEIQLKNGSNIDGIKFQHLNYNLYNNQVANEDNKIPLNEAVYKELLDKDNSKFEIGDHYVERNIGGIIVYVVDGKGLNLELYNKQGIKILNKSIKLFEEVTNEDKLLLSKAVYKELINKEESEFKVEITNNNKLKLKLYLVNNNNEELLNKEYSINIDTIPINNSSNLINSDAVYKQLLNNINSSFSYDDTNSSKDTINIQLINNNNETILNKTIDFNDKLVFQEKNQTINNKTIDGGTF